MKIRFFQTSGNVCVSVATCDLLATLRHLSVSDCESQAVYLCIGKCLYSSNESITRVSFWSRSVVRPKLKLMCYPPVSVDWSIIVVLLTVPYLWRMEAVVYERLSEVLSALVLFIATDIQPPLLKLFVFPNCGRDRRGKNQYDCFPMWVKFSSFVRLIVWLVELLHNREHL